MDNQQLRLINFIDKYYIREDGQVLKLLSRKPDDKHLNDFKLKIGDQWFKLIKPFLSWGYPAINTLVGGKRRTHSIHRLLATYFIENPDNKGYVNHIDGVKTNNSLDNLEWVTHKENCQHAYDIGLRKNKTKTKSKTIRQQKKEIVKNLLQTTLLSYIEISELSSCGLKTIRKIKQDEKIVRPIDPTPERVRQLLENTDLNLYKIAQCVGKCEHYVRDIMNTLQIKRPSDVKKELVITLLSTTDKSLSQISRDVGFNVKTVKSILVSSKVQRPSRK